MSRIEMVLPSMPAAGMEMVVARMTRGLTRRGHDVGVTCIEADGSLGRELRDEGFSVVVVPTLGSRTILFPTALAAWLRTRRPDVVHTHSGAWLKSARAARLAGVPRVVHTVHGLLDREPWHGPPMKKWAARYTAAVACVSQPLNEYLIQKAWIPPEKLHVIPNGIDTDRFTPVGEAGPVRRRFGLGADRVVIGHVARFAPVKNQRLLIRGFAKLRERHPAAFLALVGDGELRNKLEQLASELGIPDHVGFYGPADDLPPIYRDFDAFVLSSFSEGTSMSILEAMATSLCVVATDVGGNTDLLDRGRAGILVPSDDEDALAAALTQLMETPERRNLMGAAARRRAATVYGEATVLARYEALYSPAAPRGDSSTRMEQVCAE